MIVSYLRTPGGGLLLAVVVIAMQSVFSKQCPESRSDRPATIGDWTFFADLGGAI